MQFLHGLPERMIEIMDFIDTVNENTEIDYDVILNLLEEMSIVSFHIFSTVKFKKKSLE